MLIRLPDKLASHGGRAAAKRGTAVPAAGRAGILPAALHPAGDARRLHMQDACATVPAAATAPSALLVRQPDKHVSDKDGNLAPDVEFDGRERMREIEVAVFFTVIAPAAGKQIIKAELLTEKGWEKVARNELEQPPPRDGHGASEKREKRENRIACTRCPVLTPSFKNKRTLEVRLAPWSAAGSVSATPPSERIAGGEG